MTDSIQDQVVAIPAITIDRSLYETAVDAIAMAEALCHQLRPICGQYLDLLEAADQVRSEHIDNPGIDDLDAAMGISLLSHVLGAIAGDIAAVTQSVPGPGPDPSWLLARRHANVDADGFEEATLAVAAQRQAELDELDQARRFYVGMRP